jgi:tRNA-Thr(GGU) m(6)t(6)A37 methyltransferase TsaA
MEKRFAIVPIGVIEKHKEGMAVRIYDAFADGLLGLDQHSHIILLTWFDKNDVVEKRQTLRVHPRGDRRNPLTGVFATRSPVRPNLLALFVCKVFFIEGSRIHIGRVEALDGSPVIDIKPYIPRIDAIPDATGPAWRERE